MKNKKKHWTDDFPHYPDNYRDHRTYTYRLTIGTQKGFERFTGKVIEKKFWTVVQYRNVIPSRIVNIWNFDTKEEAESFMQKHDFVIPSKQN